jgi:ferredoxin
MLIYRTVKRHRPSLLAQLNAEKCVGCGTCSYVCPSKLPLSTIISKYSRPDGEEDE